MAEWPEPHPTVPLLPHLCLSPHYFHLSSPAPTPFARLLPPLPPLLLVPTSCPPSSSTHSRTDAGTTPLGRLVLNEVREGRDGSGGTQVLQQVPSRLRRIVQAHAGAASGGRCCSRAGRLAAPGRGCTRCAGGSVACEGERLSEHCEAHLALRPHPTLRCVS
ncbi:hypothetical protein B484DRAFT_135434 [Ochromonadaceae sp. CCMP2298]|nr:hypothetical protein B484DRAFT_135434 [Ochromonadaceae sp. CCMP2298]